MTLATLTAVAAISLEAAVAGADTFYASGFGYFVLTLVLFGCAWGFWTRSQSSHGTLHLRWSLIATAVMLASIGYAPSFTQVLFHTEPARQFQTACFNTGEALAMLATVLFFADVAQSVVIVDILQALLFIALRFNLVYSPSPLNDHFRGNHLIVGQLVMLFFFLVATVACLGAASRAELTFLRMLSCFFGIRMIGAFISNQVSYTWLHHAHCSLLDVPAHALLAAFALYLLWTSPSTKSESMPAALLHPPSLLVRSLMPSFLALVNLMLALFLLQISVLLAAVAISASVLCYVVRTVLLQTQVMQVKALLESRNQQLEGLAARDPLTGIGNRRSLDEAYARLHSAHGGRHLSLLLMDIDFFKQANDCHGHLYGDKILISLAKHLETLAAALPGSHCARLGGDEFILLLPEVSPHAASRLAEDLRSRFTEQVNDGVNIRLGLSIGVTSLHATQEIALESLLHSADEALYRAKRLGRDRVEVQPLRENGIASVVSATASMHSGLQHAAS